MCGTCINIYVKHGVRNRSHSSFTISNESLFLNNFSELYMAGFRRWAVMVT